MSDQIPEPRPVAELRQELRALRGEAPHLGFYGCIDYDVSAAIRALGRLLRSGISYDLPVPLHPTPQQLLDRLRAVRDELEQHSIGEADGSRALDLRTANYSTARAVVFLVDDIRQLRAERGIGAAA